MSINNEVLRKKEIFKKESGSTYVEYKGTSENIPFVKPLYYDDTYDPNPWPIKEDDLHRNLSFNDQFVVDDYLEYHE